MKLAKTTIVLVLLFSLLLSSCGQGVPQAAVEEPVAAAAAAEEEPAPVLPAAEEQPAESAAPRTLAAGGEQVTPTSVQTDMFSAKFEGSAVAGKGEAVDGVYRFTATETDGEAWHVKLECNYPTVSGRDYQVTYRFRSDVAGKIKFGDFQEFEIQEGENTVTGMMIANGGTSYLDLQLGMLPPFTIDFTEIEVKEFADEVEYEQALSSPVDFEKEKSVYEKHDQDYDPVLTRSSDEVSINYLAVSRDQGVWRSRLYIKTGLVPESGVRYHITADVTADQDMPFEVLFNSDDVEKGYGALYGQSIKAGEVTVCEAVVTGVSEGDELVLQFSLGDAPEGSTVKIGNLRVEKIKDFYTNALPVGFALDRSVETGKILSGAVPVGYKEVPLNVSFSGTDTVYEGHNDGYVVEMDESASSATLKITEAPASDRATWKVRLYAATGVTLEAGKTYQIKYKLASAGSQADYEVSFDGDEEKAYGALYGRSLTAGGTDAVEYTVTPDASHGALTLQLKLGNTDTTAGNTFTISELSLCELTSGTMTEIELPGFAYPTGSAGGVEKNSFDLEANSGAAATLSGDGSSASAKVTTPGDDWHVKLYAKPGLELKKGTTYTISMNVTGADGCTACYKNTANGEEEGFGTETITGGTVTHTVTPSENGTLEILLKIGNVPADTVVTVSDIKIRQTTSELSPVDLPGFAYPVTTDPVTEVIPEGYEAQKVSLSAVAVAWDESAATASVEGDSAKLNVTRARAGGGMWSVRLEVGTGVVLEKDVQYKVSGTLSSEKAQSFEVLYSNGSGTDEGGHNPGGQGYAEGSWELSVAEDGGSAYFEKVFTVPERSEYRPLVLRIQVGDTPAPNVITASNIKVEKWVPEHEEISGGTTEKNSFDLEANNGAAAELTGNGSSATAKVTTPGDGWHVKFYVKPGVELQAGKTYQVSMNVTGASGCTACFKNLKSGDEEGFGTETLGSGTVTHTIKPEETATLEILLKIGNVPAGTSVTVSNVQLFESTEGEEDVELTGFAYPVGSDDDKQYNSFDLEANSGAAAVLSGDGSSATATVTTPGDDWHVKLYAKPGVELQVGKSYQVTLNVSNAEGCSVCYKRLGGEETDYGTEAITSASQTVTHVIAPSETGVLEILLKIGNVPAGTAVTVSGVKIEEAGVSAGENLLSGFSFNSTGYLSRAADEGYITSLEQGGSSATLHILQAPEERNPWNVKLNVRTGFTPEKGKGYRVSFDLDAAGNQGAFEVFYDGNTEAAYGALYGQSLKSGKNSLSYTIMPGDSKGELVLQLRCGKTDGTDGNSYTISNLKLEEVSFRYTATPETREVTTLSTQSGYTEQLEKTPDRATVRLEKTPSSDLEAWKSKLFVETGVTLKAGQKYRISMEVKSTIPAPFEVCFNNGSEEKGLGAIYGLISTPSGLHVEYVTYAKQDTQLVIQLSLGNCSAPNDIILSGLAVEKAGAIHLVSDTIYTF